MASFFTEVTCVGHMSFYSRHNSSAFAQSTLNTVNTQTNINPPSSLPSLLIITWITRFASFPFNRLRVDMPAGRFCLRNSRTQAEAKKLRDALVHYPVRDP
jgi:hypothetical protein